jgi:hypothetical protein
MTLSEMRSSRRDFSLIVVPAGGLGDWLEFHVPQKRVGMGRAARIAVR